MMKLYRGPLPSLVSSAARQERFIVWCKDCRRQVDDDPADQVDRYAAKRRFGTLGSPAAGAAAPRSTWWQPEPSAMLTKADRDALLQRSRRRPLRRLIGRSQATSPDCGRRKNADPRPRPGSRKAVALLVSMGKSPSSGSFDLPSVSSQGQAP